MLRKIYKLNLFILTTISLVIFSACSSSPMRARLDKNFVYNCSLELIDKGVNAAEAERVCISSHKAEMVESDRAEKSMRARDRAATPPTPAPAPAVVAQDKNDPYHQASQPAVERGPASETNR
jgi:hypothetical protein